MIPYTEMSIFPEMKCLQICLLASEYFPPQKQRNSVVIELNFCLQGLTMLLLKVVQNYQKHCQKHQMAQIMEESNLKNGNFTKKYVVAQLKCIILQANTVKNPLHKKGVGMESFQCFTWGESLHHSRLEWSVLVPPGCGLGGFSQYAVPYFSAGSRHYREFRLQLYLIREMERHSGV